jgi:hypothetical protein
MAVTRRDGLAFGLLLCLLHQAGLRIDADIPALCQQHLGIQCEECRYPRPCDADNRDWSEMKMKRILMRFLVFTLLLGAARSCLQRYAYGHSGIRTASPVHALTQAPDVESEPKDYLELWKSKTLRGCMPV